MTTTRVLRHTRRLTTALLLGLSTLTAYAQPPAAVDVPAAVALPKLAPEDIAKAKMPDLTASDLDAAVRTIAGSARSMGITVEGVK